MICKLSLACQAIPNGRHGVRSSKAATRQWRLMLYACLLRQSGEQRQQISHGRLDIAHRDALVEPVAESIAVLYEKRGHSIARDVLIAEPHAVACAGLHRRKYRH